MGSALLDAMRAVASAERSVSTCHADWVSALQVSENIHTARKALALAEMDALKEHESLGFSSIATFARARLGHAPKLTRTLVRIGRMLTELPEVRVAALAGELTFEHLKSFDYALRHVDRVATIESASALVQVAKGLAPDEFHAQLRRLREATLDELDDAWRDGLDKRDLTLIRTTEGFQVVGFLPIDTGAKLKTIIDSAAVPRDADDRRTPAQRRVDALDVLCDSVLAHGLPADTGVRPHLRVVIDSTDDQVEAKLEKFGPIGPALVATLACDAELTRITVRNSQILDVGRSHRFATARQKLAIWHTQDGTCATDHCHHPIAHYHHRDPWATGGRTDLDNLTGLCSKCHTLTHQGRLQLEPRLARAG